MAKTYFKYAEQKADSTVNWAEIGKSLSDTLKLEGAIREQKKAAIDKASAELGETLSNAPQGEHLGLNEFAMNFAEGAQETRLQQDRLLKSGALKLKDYNISRANLDQGTKDLFGLSEKYQEVYAEKQKMIAEGKAAGQMIWQLGNVEGFGNFSKHQGFIDPTTGRVSIGKMVMVDENGKAVDKDGVMTLSKKPGDVRSIQSLNFSLREDIPKFDMQPLLDELKQWDKNWVSQYQLESGDTVSIANIRNNPNYKKAKADIIKKYLVNNQQVGSVLSDLAGTAPNGKPYEFVLDPDEVDENSILLIPDPNDPSSGKLIPDLNFKKKRKDKDGNPITKMPPLVLNNKAEGDECRAWVNKNHPDYAKEINLDKSGSFNNKTINEAIKEYGDEYQRSKGVQEVEEGEINFGQKLYDQAYNYLDTQVEMMFGKTYKVTPESASDRNTRTGEQSDLNKLNKVGALYYGTPQQIESSLQFLQGVLNQRAPGYVTKLVRDDKGVTVFYKDGSSKPLPFFAEGSTTRLSQAEWIESAVSTLTGIDNYDGLLQNSGYKSDQTFKEIGKDKPGIISELKLKEGVSISASKNAAIDAVGINEEIFKGGANYGGDEEDLVTQLSTSLGNLGVTVSSPFGNAYEKIVLTHPNAEKPLEIFINYDDTNTTGYDPASQVARYRAWMLGVLTNDFIKQQVLGGVIPGFTANQQQQGPKTNLEGEDEDIDQNDPDSIMGG